jgi:hypothetical protein
MVTSLATLAVLFGTFGADFKALRHSNPWMFCATALRRKLASLDQLFRETMALYCWPYFQSVSLKKGNHHVDVMLKFRLVPKPLGGFHSPTGGIVYA